MQYRFKEIREKAELTQREIADLLHISRGGYANIEAETANIKLKDLLTFCNQLNCTLDYVCKLENKNNVNKLNKIEIIDKNVMAEHLKLLAIEQHLQQKELANLIGIHKSTYTCYLNSNRPNLMQTLMLKKICHTYHYSMDWLIGRTNKVNKKLSS